MADQFYGDSSVASAVETSPIISSRQQAQQRGTGEPVRRSSLINPSGESLARNHSYSEAVSATSLGQADQATLSRPTTRSVQHLLQNSRARSPSASRVDASVGQYEQDKSSSSGKARRNTLAGTSTYQTLAAAASCLSLNSGSTTTSSRLTRIIFPTTSNSTSTTTHPASTQTPVPVAPVPARANSEPSDSTARETLVLQHQDHWHPVPAAETPKLPHILPPHLPLHTQSDSQIPTHPSPAVEIPPAPRDASEAIAPLTGRFRDGLPTTQDPFDETARRGDQRLALLPYYTRNETRPTPSLKSCSSSGSLSSKCSSTCDLPTGSLSPLSTRSKKDNHCSRETHRRCPSSPSRSRRRRRTSQRPIPHIHLHSKDTSDSVHMRPPSAAASFGYTPTSPLSPGSPRSHPAIMQPNRNQNSHARRPPQGFSLPLPRFHPAMYQSPSASNTSTAANSPRNLRSPGNLQPPMSPRTQQRSDEAKQALFSFHTDLMRTTGASGTAPLDHKLPGKPSLVPARSPGEATPLTLEDGPGDYLTAGAARRGQPVNTTSQRELVERMIREEEERRQTGNNSVPSSAPVSPAAGP